MKISTSTVLAIAVLVGGCSHSSTDVVKPLPDALMKDGLIEKVDVKAIPDNVSPEFRGLLVANLETAMKSCAAGTRPLRLQVSVTEFKGQNAAATIFIGGSELIKGSAQVIDPASNEIVGDYDITHSMGGGGLIAAAAMSGSERNLTIGFAGEVCEKVFGRRPATH